MKGSLLAAAVAAMTVALFMALSTPAHIERDPYFPDPAADESIIPATGGDYVEARILTDPASRMRGFERYAKRVYRRSVSPRERVGLFRRFVRLSKVQQRRALRVLAQVRRARGAGPTAGALGLTDPKLTAEETHVVCAPDSLARLETSLRQTGTVSKPKPPRLLTINRAFQKRCKFSEIQAAVNAADNGDTVLIMPGHYTEPTAREKPHNDPVCTDFVERGTRSSPAPTYEYHYKCPNDISLVTVLGRDLETDACIRCNVHIVGSGIRPEDVILDGATEPRDPGVTDDLFEEGRGQVESIKEDGIRLERTDGAYVGNLTTLEFEEFGFYSIEADGVTFDKVKTYYAHEYGHLSFATDHLLIQDGDFAGSSDAGIYPGASPPSGARINSIIRRNKSHHNNLGLSGSMGSSLLIEDNDFYENGVGITLDSVSRAGHPGFPQNSTVIRKNRIYSNNFDGYAPNAWVPASTAAPLGSGVLFAGGNDNRFEENQVWDNWRFGAGLLTVPDFAASDAKPENTADIPTSHRNRMRGNIMGVAPDGSSQPNGVDFWWDELGEQNCWEENSAPKGGLRNDPSRLPDCKAFPNIGTGNVIKEAELVNCNFLVSPRRANQPGCSWFNVPPKPAPRG